MKFVIQRVKNASVSIEEKVHSSIGKGLLVFFCAEAGDENEDILYENGIEATEKINNLTESIEQNNEAAEKIAEDIKNAQEIIYENSAAAGILHGGWHES